MGRVKGQSSPGLLVIGNPGDTRGQREHVAPGKDSCTDPLRQLAKRLTAHHLVFREIDPLDPNEAPEVPHSVPVGAQAVGKERTLGRGGQRPTRPVEMALARARTPHGGGHGAFFAPAPLPQGAKPPAPRRQAPKRPCAHAAPSPTAWAPPFKAPGVSVPSGGGPPGAERAQGGAGSCGPGAACSRVRFPHSAGSGARARVRANAKRFVG